MLCVINNVKYPVLKVRDIEILKSFERERESTYALNT